MKIADLRTEHMLAALDESSVAPDPSRRFEQRFVEVIRADPGEPTAMAAATAAADGRPSARAVQGSAGEWFIDRLAP